MAHYSSSTPKRHYGYSNSKHIHGLDKGVLQGWKLKQSKKKVTARRYVDSRGKQRYQGTQELRSTEIYPMPFAREVLDRVELLKSTCKGKPGTPTHVPPATETFARAGWPQSGKNVDGGAVTVPIATPARKRMPRAQLERPGWHFCILLFKIFRSQVEINFDAAITPPSLQQKLRMAAKARMMRWVKPKSKRKDREAPEWLKKEWAEGSKNNIADLFSHVNFDQAEFLNRLKVSVLKKQLVELTIDEGWYSESEMRGDLGWSRVDGAMSRCKSLGSSHYRRNVYDGSEEFWIIVKESGKRQESHTFEELHEKHSQATSDPTFQLTDQFKGVGALIERGETEKKQVASDPPKQDKFGQVRVSFKVCNALGFTCTQALQHLHYRKLLQHFVYFSLIDKRSIAEVSGIADGQDWQIESIGPRVEYQIR
ncbi:unnamed protein product [Effrenium voratum]|nr:unnamed protein product [Effrenium voratum]